MAQMSQLESWVKARAAEFASEEVRLREEVEATRVALAECERLHAAAEARLATVREIDQQWMLQSRLDNAMNAIGIKPPAAEAIRRFLIEKGPTQQRVIVRALRDQIFTRSSDPRVTLSAAIANMERRGEIVRDGEMVVLLVAAAQRRA